MKIIFSILCELGTDNQSKYNIRLLLCFPAIRRIQIIGIF